MVMLVVAGADVTSLCELLQVLILQVCTNSMVVLAVTCAYVISIHQQRSNVSCDMCQCYEYTPTKWYVSCYMC